MTDNFVVKDSGKRQEYSSGMRRDTQEGKTDYDLIPDWFLERFAKHLMKGAVKYGENNWQLANSEEELKRFRKSAIRHHIQWRHGDRDEDHAMAVVFNLMAAEYCEEKLSKAKRSCRRPDVIFQEGIQAHIDYCTRNLEETEKEETVDKEFKGNDVLLREAIQEHFDPDIFTVSVDTVMSYDLPIFQYYDVIIRWGKKWITYRISGWEYELNYMSKEYLHKHIARTFWDKILGER